LSIKNGLFILVISVLIPGLTACTRPEVKFAQQAENYGFEQYTVQGTTFKHRVFFKPSANNANELHIYLDGDGSPWINHRWISDNPTPRNTLVLRLMKQDQATSLYLGRPCYHGLETDSSCTPALWTSHRYSSLVVNSIAAAITGISERYKAKRIILIGHSGGGTLAMLVAENLSIIQGIITVAANLDIQAWVEHHGYTALSGSLNPLNRKPLPKEIFQLHLAGAKDKNIPVNQIRSFAIKQHSAQMQVFKDYSHHCCWEKTWPLILQSIKAKESE
jgi:hypothetical protein